MDALKTIGGATVGCFGLAAIGSVVILVAVLGFGYFTCRTYNAVSEKVEAGRMISQTQKETVGPPSVAANNNAEFDLTLENLGSIDITGQSGFVAFENSAGDIIYTCDVTISDRIPAHQSRTVRISAPYRKHALGADTTVTPPLNVLKGNYIARKVTLADGVILEL